LLDKPRLKISYASALILPGATGQYGSAGQRLERAHTIEATDIRDGTVAVTVCLLDHATQVLELVGLADQAATRSVDNSHMDELSMRGGHTQRESPTFFR